VARKDEDRQLRGDWDLHGHSSAVASRVEASSDTNKGPPPLQIWSKQAVMLISEYQFCLLFGVCLTTPLAESGPNDSVINN
jgi:hypothetical protein